MPFELDDDSRIVWRAAKRLIEELPKDIRGEAEILLFVMHDVLADQDDLGVDVENLPDRPMLTNLASICPVGGVKIRFLVPLPGWYSYFSDVQPSFQDVITILKQSEQSASPNVVRLYAFISLAVFQIALGRQTGRISPQVLAQENLWMDLDDNHLWTTLANGITQILLQSHKGHRWDEIIKWLRYGAPLYAAPESGMPAEDAARWLRTWETIPGFSGERTKLLEARRRRALLSQLEIDPAATTETAEELLRKIDSEHPAHPWVTRIEHAGDRQPPAV